MSRLPNHQPPSPAPDPSPPSSPVNNSTNRGRRATRPPPKKANQRTLQPQPSRLRQNRSSRKRPSCIRERLLPPPAARKPPPTPQPAPTPQAKPQRADAQQPSAAVEQAAGPRPPADVETAAEPTPATEPTSSSEPTPATGPTPSSEPTTTTAIEPDPDRVAAHFGADVPPPPRNKAKLASPNRSVTVNVDDHQPASNGSTPPAQERRAPVDTIGQAATPTVGQPEPLAGQHEPEHPPIGQSNLVAEPAFDRLVDEIRDQLKHRHLTCLAVGEETRAQSVAAAFALVDALKDVEVDVLIIDAVLDEPVLASVLNLPDGPGLCEVITGQIPMGSAIQDLDEFERLRALTTGRPTALSPFGIQFVATTGTPSPSQAPLPGHGHHRRRPDGCSAAVTNRRRTQRRHRCLERFNRPPSRTRSASAAHEDPGTGLDPNLDRRSYTRRDVGNRIPHSGRRNHNRLTPVISTTAVDVPEEPAAASDRRGRRYEYDSALPSGAGTLFAVMIGGYPIAWATGFGPLIFPVVAVFMLVWLIRFRPVRVPAGTMSFALFLVLVAASVIQVDTPSRAGLVGSAGVMVPIGLHLLRVPGPPDQLSGPATHRAGHDRPLGLHHSRRVRGDRRPRPHLADAPGRRSPRLDRFRRLRAGSDRAPYVGDSDLLERGSASTDRLHRSPTPTPGGPRSLSSHPSCWPPYRTGESAFPGGW